MRTLNRREFMAGLGAVGAGLLAACAPRIVEVEKEVLVPGESVEVTRVVEVAVEKEVLVPQIVEVERIAGEPSWAGADFSGREYMIWGLDYDPHAETYQRLADRFEEYTGARASIERQAWPIETAVITGIAAGLVPDVVCIMGKQIVPLIKEEAVLAVDDLVYDAVGADVDTWFSPVSIQAYQYGGKTWGVPTEGNCVSGFVNARLDFLAEAPADIQALWPPNAGQAGFRGFDEMFALAEALQQVDDAGNVTRWGLSSKGWDNRKLFGNMRTLGRDWWDPDNRTFALESDEAFESMRLYVTEPVFNLKIETEIQDPGTEAIMSGKTALCCGNVVMPASGREEGIPIDSCIYPSAIPGREALFVGEGGWGFVALSQAANQDIAIEFLKFLSTYEGQKEYSRIYGGLISSCNAVNSDDDLFPVGEVVGDALRRVAPTQPRTAYYGSDFGNPSEMETIVSTAVSNVRTGTQNVAEALAEAQALLVEMLARWDAEA